MPLWNEIFDSPSANIRPVRTRDWAVLQSFFLSTFSGYFLFLCENLNLGFLFFHESANTMPLEKRIRVSWNRLVLRKHQENSFLPILLLLASLVKTFRGNYHLLIITSRKERWCCYLATSPPNNRVFSDIVQHYKEEKITVWTQVNVLLET